MEKFESQEYRDRLAKKIKAVRKENTREQAKADLNKEKTESDLYRISSSLHELKQSLPKEVRLAIDEFLIPKNKEILERDFDVEDVSGLLSQEQKLFIELNIIEDLLIVQCRKKGELYTSKDIQDKIQKILLEFFPNKADQYSWGVKTGLELYDKITEGGFSDNRNFSHVINGQRRSNDHFAKPLDVETVIKGSVDMEPQTEFFYVCPGENEYAKQIDKPLILFCPHDMAARRFMKDLLPQDIEKHLKHVFFRRDEKGKLGYDTGLNNSWDPNMYPLLFLANYPMLPRIGEIRLKFYPETKRSDWVDVASEIINLPAGKRYKRKRQDGDEQGIEKDIKYYRDLLKRKIGIDLEKDKDSVISTVK